MFCKVVRHQPVQPRAEKITLGVLHYSVNLLWLLPVKRKKEKKREKKEVMCNNTIKLYFDCSPISQKQIKVKTNAIL